MSVKQGFTVNYILQSQEHAKMLAVVIVVQLVSQDAVLYFSMMKMEICYHQVNSATAFLTVVSSMPT